MKIILVSHPSRAHHVSVLQQSLPIVATVVDTVSAWSGHMTALRMASQLDERVAIMEDDAIPVKDFEKLSDHWMSARPNELLSFYLGTSRPRELQGVIQQRINGADHQGYAEIWLPTLIHGVCYSIPLADVQRVVDHMTERGTRIRQADFAVGAAWGRQVCYPLESLVQHRDETPVERHPDGMPRTEPRVARRLAGSLMF